MSQSKSNDRRLRIVASEHRDGGGPIDDRVIVAAEALRASAGDGHEDASAVPRSQEIADIVANRVSIEQAKGMLMVVYGIEADHAVELLNWRSRQSNVQIGLLAQQLAGDLAGNPRPEHVDLRSWCDEVLLTVHERIDPQRNRS